MGELLERAAEQQNVLDAWETTLSRLPDEPAPKPEVAAFSADLLRNLTAISNELANGTWQPGPVRTVHLPKPDGGTRPLGVPSVRDRVTERAIAAVLVPQVDPHLQPDSFGFRPGLGVADAVRTLQDRVDEGEEWVVRSDLVDCFGSVSRRACMRALAGLIDDDEMLDLVDRCVHRPDGRCTRVLGLAQGSPLSPLLVNTYLDGLDRDLWEKG